MVKNNKEGENNEKQCKVLQAPRLSESLRVNVMSGVHVQGSCREFFRDMKPHNPNLLGFLVQSFLLASVCYFQMKQTWKSSFLTLRASWLLHLVPQPGMEPRSPDFLSLLCSWQLLPSLVTRTLHHRVQAGICHI